MPSDYSFYIFLFCIFAPLVLFCLSIAGMVLAHFIKNQKLMNVCKCISSWLTLFPFFPKIAKDAGFIKNLLIGRIIALLSPPMLALCVLVFVLSAFDTNSGTPEQAIYHTAEDLHKLTGVEFPEVEPVDSSYSISMKYHENCVVLVAKKPLTKEFYKSLDKAVKKDSTIWSKDETGYRYCLTEPDNQSPYLYRIIQVFVPFNGDKITVKEALAED